ncbi:MAG: 2-phospho-L-lactate guanylyltransferase [Frankiales bacterium]|nr:2-phospho-L-lactate guanylyltransferase [Frankiales bacterium]
MAQSWGVVVPVKRLSLAKSRLASYGDSRRRALALAFAADVVLAAVDVARVLVVTDDEQAARVLAALGARVVPDDPDAGLNPALVHGAELLRAEHPDLGVATLSADLPALRSEELAAALALVPSGGRGFVADAAGTGTTLLAADFGAALLPAYGPGSRAGHLASGALEIGGGAGLRRDVDTPEDLVAAVALGVGVHTAVAIQGL